MVVGCDFIHPRIGQFTIRRFNATGIEGTSAARKVPHSVLHEHRLRESAQKIPGSESGQTSQFGDDHEGQVDEPGVCWVSCIFFRSYIGVVCVLGGYCNGRFLSEPIKFCILTISD